MPILTYLKKDPDLIPLPLIRDNTGVLRRDQKEQGGISLPRLEGPLGVYSVILKLKGNLIF